MNKPMIIAGKIGTAYSRLANKATIKSRELDEPVTLRFNGVKITVHPTDTAQSVYERYQRIVMFENNLQLEVEVE